MTQWIAQAAGVFGTGILASLSPCVYPMIPITVGFLGTQSQDTGGRKSILMYVLGQGLALVAIGAAAVKLGETLGFSSQSPSVNLAIGILLLLAGLFSLYGKLPAFLNRLNDTTGKLGNQNRLRGPLAAFFIGVSAALVASPCTSPILGGVLAMMATSSTMAEGLFLMAMYAAGFSVIFLVLGLGFLKMGKLPRSGKWLSWVHRGSAGLLFLAGGYYLIYAFTV